MDPCERLHYLKQLVPGIDCEALKKNITQFSVLTGTTVAFIDAATVLVAYHQNDDVVRKKNGKAERYYSEPFPEADALVDELSQARDVILRPSENGYNLAAAPVYFDGSFIGCLVLTHFLLSEQDDTTSASAPSIIPVISPRRVSLMVRALAEALSAGIFYQRNKKNEEVVGAEMVDSQNVKPIDSMSATEISADQSDVLARLAQYEAELKHSEERFQMMVANLPVVVFRCEINPPWYMNYISEAIIQVTGYLPEDFGRGGKVSYADIIHPEDIEMVKNTVAEAFHGHYRYEVEYRIFDINGEVHWIWERSIHALDESTQIVYLDGVLLDITEQKKNRAEKESLEILYRGLYQNMNEAVVLMQLQYDGEGHQEDYIIRDANPAFRKIMGTDPQAVINKKLSEVFPELPGHHLFSAQILQKSGVADTFEVYFESMHRFLFVSALMLNQDMMTVIFTDITRYRETQNKLMESLEEREVLVREVHHRVKNNLQAIIHLIEHQFRETNDPQCRHSILVLKNQAYTMALIYDQLNKSKQLSKIEMKSYLDELTINLQQTLQPMMPVRVRVHAREVWLDVSLAMPCAMIVNELLTNAFKYAFPEGTPEPYRVDIELSKKDHEVVLYVNDNGVGLDPGMDLDDAAGSGLKLVRLWAVHQLAGTIEFNIDHGLSVRICFPDKGNTKRKMMQSTT